MHEPLIKQPVKSIPVEETQLFPFLGEQRPCDKGKKTLVLDLDETLVHSTFQPMPNCQYIIPVEIEGNIYNVYVNRRPWACEFIEHMSQFYEVIIYTASLQKVGLVFISYPSFTFHSLFIPISFLSHSYLIHFLSISMQIHF